QILLLRLGAPEEAAAGVLGRGEVQRRHPLPSLEEPTRRGGGALRGDLDPRRGTAGRRDPTRLYHPGEIFGAVERRARNRAIDLRAEAALPAGLRLVRSPLDDREGLFGDA